MSDISLEKVTTDQLVGELLRRHGVVCSIWNVEDAKSTIADDEVCEGLTDEQVTAAAEQLLDVAGKGLLDVLAERGNNFLSDYWSGCQEEILANVVEAPTV